LLKETIMKIDSISRTIAHPVNPVPRTGSHESAGAIPFRATARALSRAIPARFLSGCRRHDAGVCELEQRMFELETHKLSTLHLGGFLR
jgi:hypothetical protein